MSNLEILLVALLIDAVIGDPDWLWKKLPHPAALMGMAVGALDRAFNNGLQRRLKGALVIAVLVLASNVIALNVILLPQPDYFEIALITILLAQNSLARHIKAVANGLKSSLSDGQKAVSVIVSRDTDQLDESAVSRAAIESAAENFSDALVAPAFWALLFGLPGIMVYKMINTADSMIGYRNDKYKDFGWAAAKLDDLVNWIPARLAGLLIAAAHGSMKAVKVMLRDARLHRSPNAGWPEAAMAAVLNVAISGPRIYDGQQTDQPFVNAEGRHDLDATDVDRAVKVIWRGWVVLLVILFLIRVLL
jgi:adenosylcobinamide-phosphate synthase